MIWLKGENSFRSQGVAFKPFHLDSSDKEPLKLLQRILGHVLGCCASEVWPSPFCLIIDYELTVRFELVMSKNALACLRMEPAMISIVGKMGKIAYFWRFFIGLPFFAQVFLFAMLVWPHNAA